MKYPATKNALIVAMKSAIAIVRGTLGIFTHQAKTVIKVPAINA